ncbi:unnamed protein product [Candida verbasci]|uniref:NDT80 domain-containing protein n=1 Tax=Candida verbasci TaxID=1227364 RepID=A0A9W4TR72_9ASCO|nr:unnamed protein product [Candida verbasci]
MNYKPSYNLRGSKSDPTHHIRSKIAPRSSLQFKIGPPFEQTIEISPIYIKSTNKQVHPIISARIDRGFDLINDQWVGYKRNYFSVVACFKFERYSLNTILQNNQFYIITSNENKHDIKKFHIRLISKCINDDSKVNIVQHTAKRDKGPIVSPPVMPVINGILPSHVEIRDCTNIRKNTKVQEFEQLFTLKYDSLSLSQDSILQNYSINCNFIKVAKYERLQFAANNPRETDENLTNKRQAINEKKRFILQVQLLAELEVKGTYAIIAISNTPPLTIRGKSPSSYQLLANLKAEANKSKLITSTPIQPFARLIKNNPGNYDNLNFKFKQPESINDTISWKENEEITEYIKSVTGNAPEGYDLLEYQNGFQKEGSSKSSNSELMEYKEPSICTEMLDPKYHLDKQMNTKNMIRLNSKSFASSFLQVEKSNKDNNKDTNGRSIDCIAPSLIMKD